MGLVKRKEKPKRAKNHLKIRGKKVGSNVCVQRIESKRKEKIEGLLQQHLGSKDAVSEQRYLKKRSFIYKCQECLTFISDKLSRHMRHKHKTHWKDAQLVQSRMRILYLWCCGNKHNRHLPLPCESCGEWYSRLDNHLKTRKMHEKLTNETKESIMTEMRQKYWFKEGTNTPIPKDQPKSKKEETHKKNEVEESPKFKRRSISKESLNKQKASVDYIPEDSLQISDCQMKSWDLTKDDYFTIYFEDSSQLLEHFRSY